VTEAHLVRPGLFLQTADLYLRCGAGAMRSRFTKRRWRSIPITRMRIWAVPDGAAARKFAYRRAIGSGCAAEIYHYPLAHFLLGLALAGMKEYERAAEAFRAAISFNPNFPEAHVRLAALLEKHLGDAESAREHRRLARRMRSRKTTRPARLSAAERVESAAAVSAPDRPHARRSICRRSRNRSSW
jgi:tetratricopeptide (TPR) repeat protein